MSLRCTTARAPTAPRLVGDPVDALTGELTEVATDFVLPGPMPLEWRRRYDSSRVGVHYSLGWGHAHDFDRTLQFDIDGIRYTGPLGETTGFPLLTEDGARVAVAGMRLWRVGASLYRIVQAGQPIMEFEFGHRDQPARLTALVRGTARISFQYGRNGALEGIADAAGRYISVYHDSGRLTRLVLIAGNRRAEHDLELLKYEYDDLGRLVRGRDAYRNVFTFEYDASHRVIRRTDRRGYSFLFTYDEDGRCVHARGEDGLQDVRLEYQPAERFTIVRQADGGRWRYQADDLGQLKSITDPYGGTRSFSYDEQGNVVTESDANGDVTTWEYDDVGAFVGKRSSLGHFSAGSSGPIRPDRRRHRVPTCSAQWEYGDLLPVNESGAPSLPVSDHVRQLVRSVRPAGGFPAETASRVEVDSLGKKTREFDAHGRTRRWTYDAGGNVVRYHDFDGAVTDCHYDSFDLPTRRTDALGRVTFQRFTNSEQIAEILDPAGTKTSYSYDLLGRVEEVWYDGSLTERRQYDSGGNLVASLDEAGSPLYTQEFGPKNLRMARLEAGGRAISYEYTEDGRFAALATGEVSSVFSYDEYGHRTQDLRDDVGVEREFAGPGQLKRLTVLGRFTTLYSWLSEHELEIRDPAGGLHRLSFLGDGLVAREMNNGLSEVARYDRSGRCTAKASLGPRHQYSMMRARQYEYSGEGNLLVAYDNLEGSTRYEYDGGHRLTHRIAPGGRRETFEFDLGDNLVQQAGLAGVVLGSGHRLRAANGDSFEYDDRGNVAARRGASGTTRFRYNARNQLLACDTPRGEWRATYDALGRRVRTTVGDETREYLWDTDRLAAEVMPTGRLRVYVYADGFAIVPLLWVEYASVAAGPTSGQVFFLMCDHRGTPTRVEDEHGEIRWHGQISPFGVVEGEGEQRCEVSFRFPGHYFELATGLHYNRFRHYSPELGRYLQPDPLGTAGGTNPYAYSANPLRDVDVRGDCPTDGTAAPAKPGTTEDGDEAAADASSGRWLSDDELQAAADSIHAELENAISERCRTTTVTQGVDQDGNVRHAVTASQPLSVDQKYRAIEILGDGVTLQEGRRTGRLAGEAHHGEQQGIAATQGQSDRRQASSSGAGHGGAACSHCAATQQQAGVTNVTGVQTKAGGEGRGDRMYFPDDD